MLTDRVCGMVLVTTRSPLSSTLFWNIVSNRAVIAGARKEGRWIPSGPPATILSAAPERSKQPRWRQGGGSRLTGAQGGSARRERERREAPALASS